MNIEIKFDTRFRSGREDAHTHIGQSQIAAHHSGEGTSLVDERANSTRRRMEEDQRDHQRQVSRNRR